MVGDTAGVVGRVGGRWNGNDIAPNEKRCPNIFDVAFPAPEHRRNVALRRLVRLACADGSAGVEHPAALLG